MNTIETKFGLDDVVCTKHGVEYWATTGEPLRFAHVEAVLTKKKFEGHPNIFYRTNGFSDAAEDELVLASEAKAYAIAWLAGRLNAIANTEV